MISISCALLILYISPHSLRSWLPFPPPNYSTLVEGAKNGLCLQIKGRQSFEGMHCCYGDSPNTVVLALLFPVKAKTSVISSRVNLERTLPQTRMYDLLLYKGKKKNLRTCFLFKLTVCCNRYIKVSTCNTKISFMVSLRNLIGILAVAYTTGYIAS